MDRLTVARLCPGLAVQVAITWNEALAAAAEQWEINTPIRQAMWLANLAHESQGFMRLVEDTHYSALRLAQVWPHRYAEDPRAIHKRPNQLAQSIGGDPVKVANDVYSARMGNGAPATGHGYLYRGRYPCMLTGKNQYEAAFDALGYPDTSNPDAILDDFEKMAMVAAWYWKANGINHFADRNDFDGACDKLNMGRKTERYGDSIGFEDRLRYFNAAKLLLEVA